jgi:hypothetical protein
MPRITTPAKLSQCCSLFLPHEPFHHPWPCQVVLPLPPPLLPAPSQNTYQATTHRQDTHLQKAAAVLHPVPAPQIARPPQALPGPVAPSCCLPTDMSHWGTCRLCCSQSAHVPVGGGGGGWCVWWWWWWWWWFVRFGVGATAYVVFGTLAGVWDACSLNPISKPRTIQFKS